MPSKLSKLTKLPISATQKSRGVRKMSEIDALIGNAGEPVPVVDVADIKAVWAHGQELRAQYPEGVAVELDVWKQVCSPGADIRAIAHRCQRLGLLEMLLRPAWTGGDFSENALKVAARMDLHWMAPGVTQKSGVEEFLGEVFAEEQQHRRSPEKAV
jgi:hypothetical protein